MDISRLEEELTCLEGDDLLRPGPESLDEKKKYIASMIEAFAGVPDERLRCSKVPEVEVLNGCGVPKLGEKVADELDAMGVIVAGSTGNAKTEVDGEEVNDFSHEESSIIYRSEDKRVEAYAEYLGVILSVTDVAYEPGPGPEVVFIAGRDRAE